MFQRPALVRLQNSDARQAGACPNLGDVTARKIVPTDLTRNLELAVGILVVFNRNHSLFMTCSAI